MANPPLEGRSLAIFVTAAVMVGLSVITVAMRCFVRLYIVRSFGWDDGLMVIALVRFYPGITRHQLTRVGAIHRIEHAVHAWA